MFSKSYFQSLFLWFVIAGYVLALPYAIVVFEWILNATSLAFVKQVPIIALTFLAVVYGVMCWRRREGFYLLSFILPSLLLFLAVVWLEPNRIKYSHIPEYLLLFVLVIAAIKRAGGMGVRPVIYFGSLLITVLLGVFDEIHHGVHAERYYGWKDMVINTAGALVGFLLVLQFQPVRTSWFASLFRVVLSHKLGVILLVLSLFSLLLSCISLFSVQAVGVFSKAYPQGVLFLNIVGVGLSVLYGVCQFQYCKRSAEYAVLVYRPILLACGIQAFIVYAYCNGLTIK